MEYNELSGGQWYWLESVGSWEGGPIMVGATLWWESTALEFAFPGNERGTFAIDEDGTITHRTAGETVPTPWTVAHISPLPREIAYQGVRVHVPEDLSAAPVTINGCTYTPEQALVLREMLAAYVEELQEYVYPDEEEDEREPISLNDFNDVWAGHTYLLDTTIEQAPVEVRFVVTSTTKGGGIESREGYYAFDLWGEEYAISTDGAIHKVLSPGVPQTVDMVEATPWSITNLRRVTQDA